MRAMVLEKTGEIETEPLILRDVPVPDPSPGEALLKIMYCGVCRTDLHIVEGELSPPRLPLIPGHQIVGVVQKVNTPRLRSSQPQPWKTGDRVGLPWLYDTCGQCRFCQSSRENLCDQIRFTGYSVDGGYAEYVVAPLSSLVRIPEDFSNLDAAPLLCAGVIGYRSLKVVGLQPGETLGLFGFGASAHLTIQVARYWNCPVLVFTRKKEHQKLALELGALWAGEPKDSPPRLCDRIITFAPAGYIIPLALKALNKGGTLAINAVHMDKVLEMDYSLLYWEKKIVSVANLTHDDAREFMQLASQIPLHVTTMVFPLESANEALMGLKHSRLLGEAVLKM